MVAPAVALVALLAALAGGALAQNSLLGKNQNYAGFGGTWNAPPKYNFDYVGCYQHTGLPSGIVTVISSSPSRDVFGGSWGASQMTVSLCAASCMYKDSGYTYAYANNGNTCLCSNSLPTGNINANGNQCNVNCPGDSTEKCGGSGYSSIYNVARVVGGIAPPYWPNDGALCNIYNASYVALDTQLQAYLVTYFPESAGNKLGSLTADQLAFRNAYLSSTLTPNIICNTTCWVNVTFVYDGAGYRNQLGIYLFDSNNQVVSNGYYDVFADASRSVTNTWAGTSGGGSKGGVWKLCRNYGDRVSMGPFPAGSRVGFYVHGNGASNNAFSKTCTTSTAGLQNCITQNGARNYACWTTAGCPMDPNNAQSAANTYSFYSQTALNADSKQHVAVARSPYGIVVGFEDLFNLGDSDYNDLMFTVATDGFFPDIPTLCNETCNGYNGYCNFQTGTCQCFTTFPVYRSNCDCVTPCTGCGVNGNCICDTGTCQCNAGWTWSNSTTKTDCDCATDPGRCFGTNGVYTCNQCVCTSGYTDPSTSFLAGTYQVVFGPSGTSTPSGWTLDTGAAISSTTLGSYGWTAAATSSTKSFTATSGFASSVCVTDTPRWTIYVQPNTNYDITVTFGDSAATTNTLTASNGNGASATIASGLSLGASTFRTVTARLNSGTTGAISLAAGAGSSCSSSVTRITRVVVTLPPCGCLSPPSGQCGANGQWNCITGCTCRPGWTSTGGGNCNTCAAGFYGPNCLPCPSCGQGSCSQGLGGSGACTCATGWGKSNSTNPQAPCDVCAPGFFGPTCQPCPNCVSGQGTCNQGLGGNGLCACATGFSGTLCDQCAGGFGGATCQPCPDCQNGVCSQGISGTGLCNCNTNYAGPNGVSTAGVSVCNQCVAGNYGASCTPCTCGQGTCNQGIGNNGACTCQTGWAQSNPGNPQSPCDVCAPGYTLSNDECLPCFRTCATCDGTSPTSCLTCKDNLLLNEGQCTTDCDDGQFDNGGTCQPCDQTCATCTGAGNDTCTSCVGNVLSGLHLDPSTSTCVLECGDSDYVDINNVCQPCAPSCSTCTGSSSSSCTSCADSTFLSNGQCVNSCPAGTYADPTTNTCAACSPSCGACSGPAANECTVCVPTSGAPYLQGTTCVSECDSSQYVNGQNVCTSCSPTCGTCSGSAATSCTSCPAGTFLINGQCVGTCPVGTYADEASGTCAACDASCGACTGGNADECLSCADRAFYYSEGQCVESCDEVEGTYGTTQGGVKVCTPCETCSVNCLNGGTCGCSTGQCQCADGWTGPSCGCSTAECPSPVIDDSPRVCSGQGSCSCGSCICDALRWGPDCGCMRCSLGSGSLVDNDCGGAARGTCNCNGTCTCEPGFFGTNCDKVCRYDACGVCNGNGLSCAGCDGRPNSGKVFDACGVCDGNNSTCAGCDGVPYSGVTRDECGVCGGDGSTCRAQNYCNDLGSCEACNVLIGVQRTRFCVWCNTTSSCIDVNRASQCATGTVYTCPVAPSPTLPGDVSQAGQNEGNSNAGIIAGVLVAVLVAFAIVGLLLYQRSQGKGLLYFEVPNFDSMPAFDNPLYREYSPAHDNPLYETPHGAGRSLSQPELQSV